jgi:hypothetical protein
LIGRALVLEAKPTPIYVQNLFACTLDSDIKEKGGLLRPAKHGHDNPPSYILEVVQEQLPSLSFA